MGFKKEYRELQTAYKTPAKIVQRILEHCLSYFISNFGINILVIDGESRFNLNQIFNDQILPHVLSEEIKIGTCDFKVNHVKLFSTLDQLSKIVLCANGRDVKQMPIARSLGTSAPFDSDIESKFAYAAYVTSDYLDEHVDAFRMNFSSIDDESMSLFDDKPTIKDIEKAIIETSKRHLKKYLDAALEAKTLLITEYVSHKEPTLRAVPHYCPEIYSEIEPNSSPEKIHEILYKHKGRAELEIQRTTERLLRTQFSSSAEIKPAADELIAKITDFQKDNLASYLVDRWRMLTLLEKKIEINSDGKFSNEDIIHDIIFPRKASSDQISFESHNLWIIDENLNFHTFAASDKPMNELVDSDSTCRPDVLAFAEVDDNSVAKSVSIIEFKKPQRRNFDQNPVQQVYGYLRQIQGGNKVKAANGRDLRVGSGTKYYCYIICDINNEIKRYMQDNGNYYEMHDGLGSYTFNKQLNSWTQILDFSKIIFDAKRRHKIFFEKLGIIK